MAPMKKNRDSKNAVRRRFKNLERKGRKYSGSSDDSRLGRRVKRKITGYKLETAGLRKKNRHEKMGTGCVSKLVRDGKRGTSDFESEPRDSARRRDKKYVRRALEFGLASGFFIPVEASKPRVFRVSSDIEKFADGSDGERSGSEGRSDFGTKGRGPGRSGRPAGEKRLIAKKNERKNVRKRERSRTRSPRKSSVQKRRKKRSESGAKPKARIQKRKRAANRRSEQPSNGRSAANDEDVDDDEDDEPDADNDEDVDDNSDEKKNKLPVASRPGSIAPNSDERRNSGDKKAGDEEPSDPSGEEGSTEDEEEEAKTAPRVEEGLGEENALEGSRERETNFE